MQWFKRSRSVKWPVPLVILIVRIADLCYGAQMTKKSATSIPGIYLITNTVTGKVYIGQAVNIRRRWESHRHYLAAGTHRNCHLQRSWIKRGPEAFVFSIFRDLSHVPTTDRATALNEAEIEALRQFPENYNLMEAGLSAPIAGPETRAIWSAQRKIMWSDPAFREMRSAATKKLYTNPEWKARRDAAVVEGLNTPEAKAAASEHFKRLWANEAHQEAQSIKRKANWADPAYRAQQKASRAATWADPEVRQRRSDAIRAAHARRRAAKAAETTGG
jgi:group I intron endonuclease